MLSPLSTGLSLLSPVGLPNPQQLAAIQQFLPVGSPPAIAEDWLVVPVLAATNLINNSYSKWSPEALQDLQRLAPGVPVTTDHEWEDVDEICGIVLGCELREIAGPKLLGQTADLNLRIAATEGVQLLILQVALFRGGEDGETAIADMVAYGLVRNVSTGGFVEEWLCPHCGVEFSDPSCPHLPPGDYGEVPNPVAAYAVRNGVSSFCELSFVLVPNCPGAQVINQGHPLAGMVIGG
jgi:hypothetical protein